MVRLNKIYSIQQENYNKMIWLKNVCLNKFRLFGCFYNLDVDHLVHNRYNLYEPLRLRKSYSELSTKELLYVDFLKRHS